MIVDQLDALLIDLDGVVYVGGEPLPGARDALVALRRRRIWLRFITNDPRPTRQEVVDRLSRIGVSAAMDDVVSSGWATACWLRQQGLKRAHVLGSVGLRQELAAQGVQTNCSTGVEAVVVGCDEDIDYHDLAQASKLIQSGARFVATNADATFPTVDGPAPATGAIVAAVAAASNQRPIVIGKPGPEMFRLAVEGMPANFKVAVVGDSMATDVLGAHRAGLPAILVTPETSAESFRRSKIEPRWNAPEAVVTSLSGLFDSTVKARKHRPTPFPWPDDVRAGVAAVVFDNAGRILLGRRLDNGQWGLPSGHVEIGETAAQAAIREVAEETGLLVRIKRLVGVYSNPSSQVFTYPDGRVTQFVTVSFACTPLEGSICADGVETAEAAFFLPTELPTPLLPMHPQWLTDALSEQTAASDMF